MNWLENDIIYYVSNALIEREGAGFFVANTRVTARGIEFEIMNISNYSEFNYYTIDFQDILKLYLGLVDLKDVAPQK